MKAESRENEKKSIEMVSLILHNRKDTFLWTTTPSSKFKHLSFQHYEYIIREITKHDAFHHGKKRNTGRTALIRSLASDVGTSVSNVYSIIKDASISILDSDLITHKDVCILRQTLPFL